MVLSEDTINSLLYFFTEKDVDRWYGWEANKHDVLEQLPILRLYLEKEKELKALADAVKLEIENYRNLGDI